MSKIVPARDADDMHDQVVRYLRDHPDFFDRNPALLRDMVIPHPSGEAVSLVERQLATLREDNARIKKRFDQVIEVAKDNEALNVRIHELALELMGASGPQAIFTALRDRLRSGLRADGISVRIFAEPAFIDSDHGGEFVGKQSVKRGPFASMLDAAKPLCGRLSRLQNDALFDKEEVASAVVLPLRGKRWDGLLGMRSDNAARFEPDMGTDLLAYLADVVTLIIDPWVAQRRK